MTLRYPIVDTEERFVKYISCFIDAHKRTLDFSKVEDVSFYVKKIYNNNMQQAYTKCLYKYPKLLYKSSTIQFVMYYDYFMDIVFMKDYHEVFAPQDNFRNPVFPSGDWEHIKSLYNKIGVYRFNLDNVPAYIGHSQNLGNRMFESLHERFQDDTSGLSFQYALTETKQDAMRWEKYYIQHLKPIHNLVYNTHKNPIQQVSNAPIFTNPINIEYLYYVFALLN